MPLSDRTKRLLDWWALHIRTNRNPNEVRKENVESNNPPDDSTPSDNVGSRTKEKGEVK